MRWLLLILAALLAVTAELTVFERLSIRGVRPDVGLAFALLAALAAHKLETASLATWIVGLVVDGVSGARMGTFALLFILSGLAAYGLKRVVAGETLVGRVLLIGLLVLIVNAVEGAAAAARSHGIGAGVLLWQAFGTATYTALGVPVLAFVGKPVFARFGKAAR